MPDTKVQNYANHTKFDPTFHFFLAPIVIANLIVYIVYVVRHPELLSAYWSLILACAAVIAVFKMRLYSLKVQDRVIRLEERLRLSQTLPEPLRSRAAQLSEGQLVGLRFASDAELPALVEKTLAGNLKNAGVKKAIVTWRPDHFRV